MSTFIDATKKKKPTGKTAGATTSYKTVEDALKANSSMTSSIGAAGRGSYGSEDVALYQAANELGVPMSSAEVTKDTDAYSRAYSSTSKTLPSGKGKAMGLPSKNAVKTKTPTTLTDENVRMNVIPELQAEVGKLKGQSVLPPVSGVTPTPPTGEPTAPSDKEAGQEQNEYEKALELYSQFVKSPESDDTVKRIDADIKTIEQLSTSGKKDSLSARRAIAESYNVRRHQIDQLYQNMAKTSQNALLLGGGARYAPLSSQGILSMQEQKHIFALSQLDAEEMQAEQEVRTASDTNNWKLVEKKLGLLKEKRETIADKEEELRKATEEKNKEVNAKLERATRDSEIIDLMRQGATKPEDILFNLNFDEAGKQIGDFTAEEVSETIKFLKENSTDPALKDTLDIYSKQLDIKKKLSDLEKAPEISSSILSKVQTIAQSYDSNPIVKNFSEVQNKEQSVKRIIDSGVGGPADLALVFEFMKALDPTSVVREAEYDSASKSGNIFAGVMAKFNGYLKPEGGFLPDNVKESFNAIIEAKLDVAKAQYKNYRSEQARKINKMTGGNDGVDYLTSYDVDFNTKTYTTLEEYVADNADEMDSIETLINENPTLSNEDILQILNAQDDMSNDELSIAIPPTSNLAYSNNNPGNLRFVGQAGAVPGEGGFAYFPSPYAGYKALENQVRLDADRGLTLRQFVEKYAPPTENDTELYIEQMIAQLGVSEDTKIETIHTGKLARAVMQKESGAVIA